MANLISNIKKSIKGIHWPNKETIAFDTLFTVVTTVVLALMISVWTMAIEYIVDLVASLF